MRFTLSIISFICCFPIFAYSSTNSSKNLFFPDTTTGIVDKSAAILMIDQAKQLVSQGKVRDALIIFREASIKDPQTWKGPFWVAYCHFKLNNFGYARQYGQEAIQKGGVEVDKDVYDILGSAYHRMGNLDSATIYYKIALTELSKNRAKELNIEKKMGDCVYAAEALKLGQNQRKPFRGDVNSGFNEYSPLLSADGGKLFFTSRRANTIGGKINPDDQEYFEDIYSAVWNPSTQIWDSVTNAIDRLNTNGFDAMSYLSADGLTAMLTINNTAVEAKTYTKSSDIYEVEFSKKGKWNAPKAIANKSINSTFYDGSACLTSDKNTMYFVSDRRGDKRSTDIYKVERVGKKWGVAVALPDSINTVGRETTPFITADGRYLFFSSDGHTGMGGMDIFVTENLGTSWSKPVNLGSGVNTVNDDTHFKYYTALNKAVLAGFNIQGQKSSMDMYEIDLSTIKLPIK